MKFFKSIILSLLLFSANKKSNSMELATLALAESAALYDAAIILAGTAASYFGYEVTKRALNNRASEAPLQQHEATQPVTTERLRQIINTLAHQTSNIELFKEIVIQEYWKGCNTLLKSQQIRPSGKAPRVPNPKKSFSNKPKPKNNPPKNKGSFPPKPETLIAAAGIAKEAIEEGEIIAEEVVHRITNLTSNCRIDNLYSKTEDIKKIANVIIEAPGKIIQHWAEHHGGTLKNCKLSGLHHVPNLSELIKNKLIDVNFYAEKMYHQVKNFRIINWRPAGEAFKDVPYKFSSIFTGTAEEYAELLKTAIANINWQNVQKMTMMEPEGIINYPVKLTEHLTIIFRGLDYAKGTVASIYPVIEKLSAFAGITTLLSGTTEARTHQIAQGGPENEMPPLIDLPASTKSDRLPVKELSQGLNSNLAPSELPNDSESLSSTVAGQEQPVTAELLQHDEASELSTKESESAEAFIEMPPLITLSLKPAENAKINLSDRIKYPSFLQKLQGNHAVMQKYGAYLKERAKVNQRVEVRYRTETFEGNSIPHEEPTINDIISSTLSFHPYSAEAADIQRYVCDLISLAAETNSTTLSEHELVLNRFKMLYLPLGEDMFSDAFASLRTQLIPIYFNKDNPYSLSEKSNKASELILNFVQGLVTNQDAYAKALHHVTQKGLHNGSNYIKGTFRLKNESLVGMNLKAFGRFFTETLNPFAYGESTVAKAQKENEESFIILNLITQGQGTLARELLTKSSTLPIEHKQIILRAFNPYLGHTVSNHPSGGLISTYTHQLREKYGLIATFSKAFNIPQEELTPEVVKYLTTFATLTATDPEKAIDSLMHLSADSRSDQERRCYNLFFNEHGILRIVAQKPILKVFELPTNLHSEKAVELRRCLNNILRFKVDEHSLPLISKALECIIKAAELMYTNREEADNYLKAAQIVYSLELNNQIN